MWGKTHRGLTSKEAEQACDRLTAKLLPVAAQPAPASLVNKDVAKITLRLAQEWHSGGMGSALHSAPHTTHFQSH